MFSFDTALLTGLLISLAGMQTQAKPLFVLDNVKITRYYELGDGSFDSSVPNCIVNGANYGDIGSNYIVAINETLLNSDRSAWCGKQVRFFYGGKEVELDKPAVIYGTCGACATEAIVDTSRSVLNALGKAAGGTDGDTVLGYHIEVVDTQIWEPAPGTASYSPTPASTLLTGGGYNGPLAATNTVVPPWKDGPITGKAGPASTISAVAALATNTGTPPSSGSGTAGSATGKKGDARCQGNKYQIMNAIANVPNGLDWVDISTCPGGCNVAWPNPCKP
ncbi:hypothetical protein IAU60_005109 [Kwoniella sp. DSM 27419]